MTATVTRLAERIRSLTPDRQIDAIARDVDGLEVLARTNAEAQRATGDAVEAIGESLVRGLAAQREHGERLERIEAGVLEAIALASRAESRSREAMASDVDLAQTVERERAAREAEAQRTREALAPILADVSRRAGHAGAAKTAGVLSIGALVTGLAAQPVETIKLIREIGPSGAGIAVVLLLVALVWARRRRS